MLPGNDSDLRAHRKAEHLEWAVRLHAARPSVFVDVRLVHDSLAEFDVDGIDPATTAAGVSWAWPLMIGAMTGGCPESIRINEAFARAATRHRIPMAVGSQRAALTPGADRTSFEVVRRLCPDGILIGNLPAQCTAAEAREAVGMIGANALQLHLNGLQELLMPEGDRRVTSVRQRIEAVVAAVDVPVIVKEVGFGMSGRTAAALRDLGVAAVDIGGQGGTSFASIEAHRAGPTAARDVFCDWGLPTAVSLAEVVAADPRVDVIAGGGIRDGLDVLKALVMGARAVSVSGVLLATLTREGEEALDSLLIAMKRELVAGMAALGVRRTAQLADVEYVVTGDTVLWLAQRGIPVGKSHGVPTS